MDKSTPATASKVVRDSMVYSVLVSSVSPIVEVPPHAADLKTIVVSGDSACSVLTMLEMYSYCRSHFEQGSVVPTLYEHMCLAC